MTKKLYVTVKFIAKKECVMDMIDLLEKLASKTKDENGCLDYGYYQSSDDSTAFTSIETWVDSIAEAEHWGTKHLKDALVQLPELMNGAAEITKYHKIA